MDSADFFLLMCKHSFQSFFGTLLSMINCNIEEWIG